jgi:hypothetical protein
MLAEGGSAGDWTDEFENHLVEGKGAPKMILEFD